MREGCLGHGGFRIFLTRTTIPEDVHPEHRGTKDQATEQDRYQHPSASCPLSAPFSGKPFFWRTLVGETNKTNKFGRDRDDKMMRTGGGGLVLVSLCTGVIPLILSKIPLSLDL